MAKKKRAPMTNTTPSIDAALAAISAAPEDQATETAAPPAEEVAEAVEETTEETASEEAEPTATEGDTADAETAASEEAPQEASQEPPAAQEAPQETQESPEAPQEPEAANTELTPEAPFIVPEEIPQEVRNEVAELVTNALEGNVPEAESETTTDSDEHGMAEYEGELDPEPSLYEIGRDKINAYIDHYFPDMINQDANLRWGRFCAAFPGMLPHVGKVIDYYLIPYAYREQFDEAYAAIAE